MITGKSHCREDLFFYCLEEEDNGKDIHLIRVLDEFKTEVLNQCDLGKLVSIKAKGEKQIIDKEWEQKLYRGYEKPSFTKNDLTFIPYHLWGNRTEGEM
ncbi:hypothetical protein [Marinilactibacillus psychrotolerans]|uniref:hypothetical protein n=1 Tax=Marinilactibacillus psychrotolerans TaxID=191770 RepID=UPI0038882447